jgi:peroxiredoxin
MIAIGDAFPALPLPTLDGSTRALADAWAGGPALFVFGHSGCDTTRFTLPHAQKLFGRRTTGSVTAVLQDQPADARELVERLRLTMPVLLDPAPYAVEEALGATVVPMLFLVGQDGRVQAISEAFRRADVESFAAQLGVPAPLYGPQEKVPALRPG